MSRSKLRAVVGAPLASVLVSTLLAATVAAQPAPDSAVASPSQMIVVSVPEADSPTGVLTAYQRDGSGWKVVLGPTSADLGELGVGAPQDDVFRTPVGTFPLGQAFGREPNPGTRMPYFQATDEDWWDEDPDSPTYNTHVRAEQIASTDAENLYDSGSVYDYAVLIEHNPARIPGRSAGIFLHVSDGEPTWGCVAIGRDEMRSVLRWLDPAASPHITIGVEAGAPTAAA
jgi:L,D-peptidoglycan transpeptidase YkuD (ErfK/YbiS/YcfS/YnhG family)